MREAITTLGELVAALLVAIGFGMYALPLGVIVGGILLGVLCWLAAR
jgi:uncharacterized membrane protein AbrB (regulator of aidB expression)